MTTLWSIASRMPVVMGPTWQDGSSTTAEPVQWASVGTVIAVVLKPPLPAKTAPCVASEVQGSISSGALPPWPQVFLSPGSKRTPATLSWSTR